MRIFWHAYIDAAYEVVGSCKKTKQHIVVIVASCYSETSAPLVRSGSWVKALGELTGEWLQNYAVVAVDIARMSKHPSKCGWKSQLYREVLTIFGETVLCERRGEIKSAASRWR
jgi:hypothetical protein